MTPRTLFDKVWDTHVVRQIEGGRSVLYIDRHYIHEVTSPVAFAGLDRRGLKVLRPGQTTATADHNVPTACLHMPIADRQSREQLDALERNCALHDIEHMGMGHPRQGVVHIVGPELGLTLPGTTIVCGDSHTSTHGAFGAVAFGIGTSEVEMVLASQCLLQPKPRAMRITVEGKLGELTTAKDLALYIISKISASGGTGCFIEFAGEAVRALSMEGRMTLCNMSIECGARGGMIAPDQTTFDYLRGRQRAPQDFDRAVEQWKELFSDQGARFEREFRFDAADVQPMITYGTNPAMALPITGTIPVIENIAPQDRAVFSRALEYMDFSAGDKMEGKRIDYVFLGSCTNGRIEDFRLFANAVQGRHKADRVTVWLVPGSKMVQEQIRAEGLGKILEDAGFEVREPGCSACLAMNPDRVPAGKYCISTANRNFEGRQGQGARTLLAGALVAAAAAVTGIVCDPRKIFGKEANDEK